jgi:hypothetical protein
VELLLRGGASTRFHPKRRASIDHRPGPKSASAPPIVANNTRTQASPGSAALHSSSKATEVPAMGVQSPGMRRIPKRASNAAIISVEIGASLRSVELARTTSVKPRTRRMTSRPVPGRPPANVEYRRRNSATPFCAFTSFRCYGADRNPQKSLNRDSLKGMF